MSKNIELRTITHTRYTYASHHYGSYTIKGGQIYLTYSKRRLQVIAINETFVEGITEPAVSIVMLDLARIPARPETMDLDQFEDYLPGGEDLSLVQDVE